ncbi:MAG TPA: 2-oxoglutarate and iron-dependent oxygenase domain-containing protein [Acidimicrobiales bacterium]
MSEVRALRDAGDRHEVPEIDVGPLVRGDDATAAADVAAAIDRACREVGFFCIVGHGVDPARRERLDRAARAFFARPEAEKAEIAMARAGRAWRGWFPLGGELTAGVPDRKEGLYFGQELGPDHPRVRAGTPLHGANLFPAEPADLRPAVLDWLDALTRLGQVVLRGIALGLGRPASWFADDLTADPLVLFRIFRYPPVAATPDAGPGGEAWGVGEHTDYGLLTLLAQDGNPGLEVKTPGGWVAVDPRPDAFVCNLGDMLARLSGGRYVSTPHRVRNRSGAERLSFPFFLDPGWDAVVDPATGGTYGDYILAKVRAVFPALAQATVGEA